MSQYIVTFLDEARPDSAREHRCDAIDRDAARRAAVIALYGPTAEWVSASPHPNHGQVFRRKGGDLNSVTDVVRCTIEEA